MVAGFLLVDKPSGPTSHDIVSTARRLLGTKKVGHAGTLDPLASGLLVLGVGQATKLLTFLVGADKSYQATIRLGWETLTDDSQGEPTTNPASRVQLDTVTDELIAKAAEAFRGEISQVPSAVSAIKVSGKRSYQRVREGEEVELAARVLTISRCEWGNIRREDGWIDLDAEVDCSSGTYVRAIARDLGRQLGVGGHLVALRRTRVGPFGLDRALRPEDISPEALMGISEAARAIMPVLTLAHDQATELRHGRMPLLTIPPDLTAGALACLDEASQLVAIVSAAEGALRILVGFPTAAGG